MLSKPRTVDDDDGCDDDDDGDDDEDDDWDDDGASVMATESIATSTECSNDWAAVELEPMRPL